MLFISVVYENETAITMTQTSSIETMLQHLVIRLFATFGFLSQTTHRFSVCLLYIPKFRITIKIVRKYANCKKSRFQLQTNQPCFAFPAEYLVMDARSAMRPCYILPMFFIGFLVFFMAALVGQTAERIFTKLSHVVDISCYLRTY